MVCITSQIPFFSLQVTIRISNLSDACPVEVARRQGMRKGTDALCQLGLEWKLYFIVPQTLMWALTFPWGSAFPSYGPLSGKHSPFDLVPFVSTCICKLKLITGSLCY